MATPCHQIGQIAALTEKVANLERWEDNQNGSLTRIEAKVDSLHKRFDDKVESLRNWILGALLSCALCLLSVLLQYLRAR